VATAEEIAAFRLLINQPDDVPPYDDASLSARLDGATSVQSLASTIWLELAASYSSLVSVAESGSSRQLSDLHKNALAMAKAMGDSAEVDPGEPAVRGTRMHRLTRP